MSAAPRHPGGSGYAGLRMTADEFLALGETRERYELIDGVVVMSPSASGPHSEIAVEIIYQLKSFAHQARTIRVFADIDTRFGPMLVYRPDVLVYLINRLAGGAKRRDLMPDLAVEILSPSNRSQDLVTRRHDYNHRGVGEYWIIDPEAPHASQFRALQRQGGGAFTETLATGDSLPSSAIAGFTLDLAPIRAIIEEARRIQDDH